MEGQNSAIMPSEITRGLSLLKSSLMRPHPRWKWFPYAILPRLWQSPQVCLEL